MMNSCPACKKENPKIAIFCETCNYPFEGAEKEKAIHIGRFVTKKGVTIDSEIQINRSRSILFIIAMVNGLAIAMSIANSVDYSIEDYVFNIIITSVFILCAITIKKNPFVKILIPLLLLLFVNLLNFIVDPNTLLQGIVLKVIYIGSLSCSLYLVKSAENFRKKYH